MNRYLWAVLCLFALTSAKAQLRVELSFEQETYLPDEPLEAIVRIYNSSGQTLVLGHNPEWLSFTVEAADGSGVKSKKRPDVEGEFSLPSAHRAKKIVNLAEAFELNRFGRYNVRATVHIDEWNQNFETPVVRHFGISPGVKLWETAFGIPSEKSGSRPEIRKFLVVQANHLKALTLYVRITDDTEAETFALRPLGTLLGLSKPEPQLDRWSNLHVLYQDGARSFKYTVITPDGSLLARQTWDLTAESRPAMAMTGEGRIEVRGGVRRVSASDLPPPELLSDKSTQTSAAADPISEEKPEKPAHAEKPAK